MTCLNLLLLGKNNSRNGVLSLTSDPTLVSKLVAGGVGGEGSTIMPILGTAYISLLMISVITKLKLVFIYRQQVFYSC